MIYVVKEGAGYYVTESLRDDDCDGRPERAKEFNDLYKLFSYFGEHAQQLGEEDEEDDQLLPVDFIIHTRTRKEGEVKKPLFSPQILDGEPGNGYNINHVLNDSFLIAVLGQDGEIIGYKKEGFLLHLDCLTQEARTASKYPSFNVAFQDLIRCDRLASSDRSPDHARIKIVWTNKEMLNAALAPGQKTEDSIVDLPLEILQDRQVVLQHQDRWFFTSGPDGVLDTSVKNHTQVDEAELFTDINDALNSLTETNYRQGQEGTPTNFFFTPKYVEKGKENRAKRIPMEEVQVFPENPQFCIEGHYNSERWLRFRKVFNNLGQGEIFHDGCPDEDCAVYSSPKEAWEKIREIEDKKSVSFMGRDNIRVVLLEENPEALTLGTRVS